MLLGVQLGVVEEGVPRTFVFLCLCALSVIGRPVWFYAFRNTLFLVRLSYLRCILAAYVPNAILNQPFYHQVVTFSDMMEMLTNYDYTIDVTSDAGGEAETWGTEAGYGIISAAQMLGWIALNCQESCPGE